jgi:hypothetical protein
MRRKLEASWHKTTKPCDLTSTVNDAVARQSEATKGHWGAGTVHVLIWGGMASRDLLNRQSVKTSEALVNKALALWGVSSKEGEPCKPTALMGVTLRVIKQKSADGIVAKCPA